MSGFHSLLHLGPESTKLRHQLRGFLPCGRVHWWQRALLWRICVPHTYNSSESVFWTGIIKKPQKASISVRRQQPEAGFDNKSLRKTTEGCNSQQRTAFGELQEHRFQSTSKQKTPVVEHKGLFSRGVSFLTYASHLQ
jgi:hypothetical protein